jgi:AcrR family transcriptional regulator
MNQDTVGTKGERSRDQLIECAARLFLEKGYNATGINEIISCAGMSKGSFYFYFPSKKDLAIAVTDYHTAKRLELISEAAAGRTWETFVEKIIGDITTRAKKKNSFGCPFAVMGMETAFIEPDIALRNLDSLKALTDIFEDVLKRSGVSEEKAPGCAKHSVALYEGYLIFYRLSKDTKVLEQLLEDLKTYE